MEDTGVVNSGADLASSFTADSGDSSSASAAAATTTGAGAVADTSTEVIEEPLSPDAEGGEEFDALNDPGSEALEEEPVEAVEETKEEPVAALPEELPEGVRKGKDRSGKDGYWLQPNRYELFHGAYKTLRSVEDVIGEPFSVEAIALRDRAYAGQERLYGDFLSGVPEQQGKVIQHLLDEAKRAQQEGEVGVDPLVPFSEQFYSALQKSNPAAYAKVRRLAADDLVDEMYQEAAEKGNRSLWLSAQHFDKVLGRKWKPETDMANFTDDDPTRSLRAEVESLRKQINEGTASNSAAQFEAWRGSLNQSISKTVGEDAIAPALIAVKDSYAKFPDTWKAINDRLHSKVLEGFKQDERFQERVRLLIASARRAPSAQRRQEIAENIQLLHKNKAKLIVEAQKAQVLSEAGARLKEQSDAAHKRRQAAQKQQAPAGGRALERSLVGANGKAPGMDFDVATPEALAASLRGLLTH